MKTNNRGSVLFFTFFLALISFLNAKGQTGNRIATWIHSMESVERENNFQPVSLFQPVFDQKTIDPKFSGAVSLELRPDILRVLLSDAPASMEFLIPVPGRSPIVLQLAQVNITTPDFSVGTKNNEGGEEIKYTNGIHYRGIIEGDDHSIATISIFNDELIGMISSTEGNFNIGKMDDGSESYVLYNASRSAYQPPMNCFTDDSGFKPVEDNSNAKFVACRVVKVYFECDYQMYLDKDTNVTNVSNYVTGLFNQVAALYANEDIETQIQEIKVWTSTDPYVSYNKATSILPVFSINNFPLTKGDLAHFLSTRSIGGGVANISALCNPYSAFAVSGIYNSYSSVPTYSWSVEVVTHEMGHNLGSPHTHNCSWAGGAIDNCGPVAGYPTEGACADGPVPTNGGTIMSYCHLVGSVGINFANGFGPLPGALIRNRVTNASCVFQTGVVPAGLTASNVLNETATLSWNAVPDVTLYTARYRKTSESVWTNVGTVSTTSVNIVGLTSNTNYTWSVKTDCSNYSTNATFKTITVSGCNKPTGLAALSVTDSSATLKWNPVGAATSYTLQYKLSISTTWTVVNNMSGTTYALTGLKASCTYQWKVKANCSGYTSANFSTPKVNCDVPTDLFNYAGGKYASLSWKSVPDAAYYTVRYKKASSGTYILWGNTLVPYAFVQNLTPSTAYNWKVKANCSGYTAVNNFTTTSDTIQGGGIGLQEPELLGLQISPNPAGDFINVRWDNSQTGETEIQMTDITGRTLLLRKTEGTQLRITTASLSQGIYFISLKNVDGYIITRRFMKE